MLESPLEHKLKQNVKWVTIKKKKIAHYLLLNKTDIRCKFEDIHDSFPKSSNNKFKEVYRKYYKSRTLREALKETNQSFTNIKYAIIRGKCVFPREDIENLDM